MAENSVTYGQVDKVSNFKRWMRSLPRRLPVILVASTTVFAGVAAYTFTRPSVYESSTALLFTQHSNNIASSIRVSTPPNKLEKSHQSDGDRLNLSTEIAILQSLSLIESAVAKLKSSQTVPVPANFATQIANNLSVRQEHDAMVLRLTYRDGDRHRAQQVLSALTETYGEHNLKDKRAQTSNAIQLIQSKIPQLRQKLDNSARAVTQFRKKHNISDPDTYAASVYEMKQTLEQQELALKVKITEVETKYKELQKQVGNSTGIAIDKAILAQDTTYQNLVKQFQDAEINYYTELTKYRETHPAMRSLKDKRDRLYSLMQAQIESALGSRAESVGVLTEGTSEIRQTLATQLFEAQTAIAMQTAQLDNVRLAKQQVSLAFAQIPQLQQTYTELQRQFSFNSSLFTKFSERLEELRIENAQEIPAWRLLERPLLPEFTVEPNVLLNLLLGGFGGIALAIAIAQMLERSDRRLRDLDEFRALINLPLLGTVPKLKALQANSFDRAKIVPSSDYTVFTESLRSLAINLRYSDTARNVNKSIAFTSAIPSEGKSTLIYHLGCVLAELEHNVLLVDADLRRPTIHKLAGLHNSSGLSTAIATNLDWREIVQTVGLHNSLDVLTSGPIPPNPLVLLESAKMTKLMQAWQQTYDYVLIDTPPIVGIVDAQSLAIKVDTVVVVAAMHRSPRSAIARALEILASRNANIAGILVNMVARSDSNEYYTDYQSYYSESSLLQVAVDESRPDPSIPALESDRSTNSTAALAETKLELEDEKSSIR
jgi:polysaccharide biosynthesis transport protein